MEKEKTVEKKEQQQEQLITKEKVDKKVIKKNRVPKEITQEIIKKIFKNLILAIGIMLYFIVSYILYIQVGLEKIKIITKAFSGIFLLLSIIILEFAYKKDSGTYAITAIEILILSIHALFIEHIIAIYKFDFRMYLLTSAFVFAIYYILKSIIIFTRARIKYLKTLSDISEIVKDEPIVKEAKKRKDEFTDKIEKIQSRKEENIEEKTTDSVKKETKQDGEKNGYRGKYNKTNK